MDNEIEIRIEYFDFELVESWPRNPKDHDLHEIKKSFYRFGFIKPVLVDEGTKKLVAGHGRLRTLRILKDRGMQPPRGVVVVEDRWLIPVLRGVEFADPAEAEAFLLADNRLTEIGGWKQDILDSMLEEMVDVDGLLEGTGFNIADVVKEDESELLNNQPQISEEYLVVVTCDSEEDQFALLEELIDRNIKCKALVA